ncbi:unnamed protein product [Leptosia nina]|uniref:Uncharacterized protein n=1 Tax=Leptosia nina TaxID=320188 RepID=A0AAV1J831_9NEOP
MLVSSGSILRTQPKLTKRRPRLAPGPARVDSIISGAAKSLRAKRGPGEESDRPPFAFFDSDGLAQPTFSRVDSLRELHYTLHKKHCVERQRGIEFPGEDISEIELHILKKKCGAAGGRGAAETPPPERLAHGARSVRFALRGRSQCGVARATRPFRLRDQLLDYQRGYFAILFHARNSQLGRVDALEQKSNWTSSVAK